MVIMRMQTIQLLAQGEGGFAEVCKVSEEVFQEKGPNWLFTPNWALGGKAPVELCNSEAGIQTILDVLCRIQWGVFS